MKKYQNLIIIILSIFTTVVSASELTLSSVGKKPVFIELFTSQGCSSCPPAEKYLNNFENNAELWDKYIPIAFHVDYWDYIGWKDVFAKKIFASRQYRYAKLKHVRTVYTPAFVVNGKTWRKGFFNSYPQMQGLNNGVLEVSANNNKINAIYKTKQKLIGKLNLNVAVLGMNISVNITAGENEGRKSKHNFVVLNYKQKSSRDLSWQLSLPSSNKENSDKHALVVWVSEVGDPTPIQAVGGWIK